MNSLLQPINRKQFLIYELVWFLCAGAILAFLAITQKESFSMTSHWWITQLGWFVDIILYYKRLKDIAERSYDGFNYYSLLIIPIIGLLLSIGTQGFIVVPAILFGILTFMAQIFEVLSFALLIFLFFKKGKN